MTMPFSLHESMEPNSAFDSGDTNQFYPASPGGTASDGFRFLRGKLEVPSHSHIVVRPRINTILRRSVDQFPATLVSGRAGTGKTALAADFARERENVAWFSVESSDCEWTLFSRYFSKCLSGDHLEEPRTKSTDSGPADVAKFLAEVFSGNNAGPERLVVLDDIHHIFDAEWFDGFFQLLLYSLPMNMHLLALCRSKPPSPLWRLRSKQMLNVLDEKVIAFTPGETEELYRSIGLPAAAARDAHRRCYGRVSKLLQFGEKAGSETT